LPKREIVNKLKLRLDAGAFFYQTEEKVIPAEQSGMDLHTAAFIYAIIEEAAVAKKVTGIFP